jgi:hypothetical protein
MGRGPMRNDIWKELRFAGETLHEHKVRCRNDSARLKAKGVLVPQPCEVCGRTKVDMHHEDYDHPGNVRWLCRRCHKRLHHGSETLPRGVLDQLALLDTPEPANALADAKAALKRMEENRGKAT